MRVALIGLAVVAGACGRIAFDDALDDAPCATWFADLDGDGHGDPMAPVTTCSPGPQLVESSDDCDDGDRHRYPGAPEVCDGMDNDCDPLTIEVCPAGCSPVRRPAPDEAHAYLACTTAQFWHSARAVCASQGFDLIVIDDANENGWLRQISLDLLNNTEVFLGGTDEAVEGTWTWVSGVAFWQGDAQGAALGGQYTNWSSSEPNNQAFGDGEDCALQLLDGRWYDVVCDSANAFACERD
jgi:hypothetical protein